MCGQEWMLKSTVQHGAVVSNNVLYSSDYIAIVLSQENFESLRHYFFFHLWSGSNNLHYRWLLWNLNVWVIITQGLKLKGIMQTTCRLTTKMKYLYHTGQQDTIKLELTEKKKTDGKGILDEIYGQWRKTI